MPRAKSTTRQTRLRTALVVRAPHLAPWAEQLWHIARDPQDKAAQIALALLCRTLDAHCTGCGDALDHTTLSETHTPFVTRTVLRCGACGTTHVTHEVHRA